MKNSKVVVPVRWFRVAVASQLFMEGAAGYLLFWTLREVTRALEPATADSALGVLSLIETAYFAVGFMFLLYCAFFAMPPSEDDFTKTKWWMAWALLHKPNRRKLPRRNGVSVGTEHSGAATGLNPATGMAMMEGTLLDIGGNTFGSGSSDSDFL